MRGYYFLVCDDDFITGTFKKHNDFDVMNEELYECSVDYNVWLNLSKTTKKKIYSIMKLTFYGAPIDKIGGRVIKCNPDLIRFRVGRNYRLVMSNKSNERKFFLYPRQSYEKNFKNLK